MGYGKLIHQLTSLSLGIYDLQIIANAMNYQTQTIDLQCEVDEYYATEIDLVTAPTSQTWGNNVTFVIQYLCNEEPRNGPLLNATLNQLDIYYVINNTEYYQLSLYSDSLGVLWGWEELGNGEYGVWMNSGVLNMTQPVMYYIDALFSLPLYQNGLANPYVWIYPLQSDIAIQAPYLTSNTNFNSLNFLLNQTTTILVTYFVTDPRNPGFPLEGAMVQYTIYNQTDRTIEDQETLDSEWKWAILLPTPRQLLRHIPNSNRCDLDELYGGDPIVYVNGYKSNRIYC